MAANGAGRGHRLVHEAKKIRLGGDQVVAIFSHPVLPQKVFICPGCQNIRYKLFCVAGRWACYRCHRLTHSSRHFFRQLPKWHRLMLLRRKIGAPLVPFWPIAPRPLHHRRYRRLAREIRALEARLIEHGQDIAAVLEKRHGRP